MSANAGAGDAPRVTVAEALRAGAARLRDVADNPGLEARLLLAHALGATQNDLIRDPGWAIDPAAYNGLLARRQAWEPLAYITGHREFWSLDFLASPATLIPRADSETLVEAAIAAFAGRMPPMRILDLGAGTGCLLLALLHEFPAAFGIGIDITPEAALLARTNSVRLGLGARAGFITGNWTDAVAGCFDLVVSNPPYIAAPEIDRLMPEVAEHEPRGALDGGADGMDAYRTILARMPDILAPDGTAVLELGAGQADLVTEIARGRGFTVSLRLDLARIPRALLLQWPDR
ncbi:MAG TPA: peptide chain release factor N(5)-glutamine methyltransferase [Rhodopila sp.]|nr:peptide chain release factor N(5)-glutamine methyltransferase [Rhodopila sp.]